MGVIGVGGGGTAAAPVRGSVNPPSCAHPTRQAMKYPPVVAKRDGEALDRLELDAAELVDDLDDMEDDDGGDL